MGENETTTRSDSWQKDFVEHLRTVHFSLIIVAVGLLLMSLSKKNYETDGALRQINEIIRLRNDWSMRWIQVHAKHTDTLVNSSTPNNSVRLTEFDGLNAESEILYAQLTTDNNHKSPSYILLNLPPNVRFRGSMSFPKNLAEFSRWWDSLNRVQAFELTQEISNEAWLTQKSGARIGTLVISSKPFSKRHINETAILKNYDFDIEGDEIWRLNDDFDLSAHLSSASVPLRIQATRVVSISIDQNSVIKEFPDWVNGDYKDSFRDLRLAATGNETLPFSDVSQLLSIQAGKAPENFEVFGLKFPTDDIAYWGALLILALQLYLLIYVRQLSNKLNKGDLGWDVPWVGMNQSKPAKFLYLLSVLILPMLTLIILSIRIVVPSIEHTVFVFTRSASPSPSSNPLSALVQGTIFGAAILISPILSIAAWRSRPRLGK